MGSTALEDAKIPTRIKISALWTSVMFCYVYADYFQFYVPGKLPQAAFANAMSTRPLVMTPVVSRPRFPKANTVD